EDAAVARRIEQDTSVVALPAPRALSGRGLGETIHRRGSTRQFSHAAITADELGTALWAAARGFDADVPAGLVDIYLVVNSVAGGRAAIGSSLSLARRSSE